MVAVEKNQLICAVPKRNMIVRLQEHFYYYLCKLSSFMFCYIFVAFKKLRIHNQDKLILVTEILLKRLCHRSVQIVDV